MPPISKQNSFRWLGSGEEVFPALAAAIEGAQKTVRLEVYAYANDELGARFRAILLDARKRGVRVQVLIDAIGSIGLTAGFWEPLVAAGGEVRWFNPVLSKNFGVRDHRKILVCDEEIAFIGGFNMTSQYQGDGIKSGWRDLGLEIVSPLAVQLAAAFDEMFALAGAEFHAHKRAGSPAVKRDVTTDDGTLLLSGPGRGRNPFNRSLRNSLAQAKKVQIIVPYFVPTWRIRRDLLRVVRDGGIVQLILAGKSDVLLSYLAGRSLYRRLLRGGVEIYEYQPQILHAKLMIIDDSVYVGSSNLDPRSLYLNYELMVRFENKKLVAGARELFDRNLKLSRRVETETWHNTRTWWRRFKQRWAYFIVVRVDPLIARWNSRRRRR